MEGRLFLGGKIDLAPIDPCFAGILLIEFQNIVAVVQGVFRYLPGISRTRWFRYAVQRLQLAA